MAPRFIRAIAAAERRTSTDNTTAAAARAHQASTATPPLGGTGVQNKITGTAVFYAAGGSALEGTAGAPGGAGHRTGGTFGSATYQPAADGTGAGGQGGWGVPGNKGASGVVIVAYKAVGK